MAVAALMLAGSTVATADVSAVAARPDFQLPFQCGQKWQLNAWDHLPALDMVREPDQVGTEGAAFVAAAAGTVRQSFFHGHAGNLIQIDHGGGWFTTGIHLQSRAVSVGQRVSQGQLIGRVGHTGPGANGRPHLHFEQAFDADGNGSATWGEAGSERVTQVFDGVTYNTDTLVGKDLQADNVTSHNCAPSGPGQDSTGYYDPRDGTFHLRDSLNAGSSDYAWDTGLETIPGAKPLVGDWNGDGKDSTGYYDPRDGTFHLRNDLDSGASDYAWDTDLENIPGAVILIGNWDGAGGDSTGYYDPRDGTFHLRNPLSSGSSSYGWDTDLESNPAAVILIGDWDGAGGDSTGYYDPRDGTFHLRNPLDAGTSSYAWDTDLETNPGARPVTGDWNADGKDSTGYFDPRDGSFHLRNALNSGESDYAWDTGLETNPAAVPLIGDWDGA